jgi:Sec-independent protein translocase protein TatA
VSLGPERLQKVAMRLGNWAGQARRMARQLTTQIRTELDMDGVKNSMSAGYKPNPGTAYRRPGVDDLKPGESAPAAEASPGPEKTD